MPAAPLVNQKWKRPSDYEFLEESLIDEGRVARTDNILKSLGIDYKDGDHVPNMGNFMRFPNDPSVQEEAENEAFEETFSLDDRRITRGYLNRFFQCRHEHFCYFTDIDMQEWAYYVFDYYLERINEVIICSDLFSTDQKIAMIDLHHWVEHYRIDEFHIEIHMQKDIESWKGFWERDYSLAGAMNHLFQSL